MTSASSKTKPLQKEHRKCIRVLEKAVWKKTQAFIQSPDKDWAKKTPNGGKGARAFTHWGKRPNCRSTAAGRRSTECRLRGWEPGSWKGKWTAWEWRKERNIQGVQGSVLTEAAIAGGGSALPAWSSTLSRPAGEKVAQNLFMALILYSSTLLWWFMWTSSLLAW